MLAGMLAQSTPELPCHSRVIADGKNSRAVFSHPVVVTGVSSASIPPKLLRKQPKSFGSPVAIFTRRKLNGVPRFARFWHHFAGEYGAYINPGG
jgi:hypothetical protein